MTATVELTEAELAELRDLTRAADAQTAVHSALDEFRRYAPRMRLKELSGQVAVDDNWRAPEAAEYLAGIGVASSGVGSLIREAIPRHQEIKKHLARSICRRLGVEVPKGA